LVLDKIEGGDSKRKVVRIRFGHPTGEMALVRAPMGGGHGGSPDRKARGRGGGEGGGCWGAKGGMGRGCYWRRGQPCSAALSLSVRVRTVQREEEEREKERRKGREKKKGKGGKFSNLEIFGKENKR
jgi:hypothetical protein